MALSCMAFQPILCSYIKQSIIHGIYMRSCIHCSFAFKNMGPEKCCSIKCKILEGIEKQDNGCWLYKKSSSGIYSKLRWNMKWISGHRASFESFISDIPKGKVICHKCDTPKCVNPEHLFVGTHSENMRDSFNKKRKPVGEKNHFSRFTNDQINEMRLLKSEGFTYLRLKRIFNCSMTTIWNVIKNHIRKENDGVPQ